MNFSKKLSGRRVRVAGDVSRRVRWADRQDLASTVWQMRRSHWWSNREKQPAFGLNSWSYAHATIG